MAQQPNETQTTITEEEVAARHENFVLACNRLLQTARIHEADNQLSVKAGENWIASAKKILAKDPEIIIESRHERIFLQGNKLLLKQHTAAGIFGLLGWFNSLGLHGLKFRAPAAEVTPRQACELARTIIAGQTADNPLEYLQESLAGDGFPWKEFHEIKQHPINSVRQILKLEAYRDLIAQILLPPFEHHLNYNLSGYPEVPWSRSISLFGRIIEICDVYDALSAPRVYRNKALSQDRVLGLMFSNSGKKFDPVLLKWFINMVGVYPVGTLVKLISGEVGLIYQNSGTCPEQGMPLVLLLKKKHGGELSADRILDLNTRDKKTGKYLRSVKSTHNPYEYGIQPAVYLMQAE